ncbi:3-deoxy-D-manno-octulosonic-acid transferase [Colwellia psychrerythraea 34H]|uniref:3-deoxy-D-manno-octulosonic acid transferase n=1 Tax=Colwellia psychrerythraea (strain 34H / ATCC BAA-681) TaxID=167879 RepID=Q48AM7_COLP3|nr:lipid IV(A) 3-deoxy-D-manno-octulosonic acid transferase [Colwellia psychrerythraea]AAZ25835.1 3-deoxy-D-manno-octulosonic-acid transferase [Colwellia psychrerythraea 34H]
MRYVLALFFYRVFLLLLTPIVLLVLLIRSFNHPEYRQRLFERLGFFPKPYKQGGIVVHAASVGEVIALKSFIEKLLVNYPDLPITITSFTPTGSAQITKLFGRRVQHGYLPLDIFPCTTLFLHRLKPKMIIFMETELWPNLIAQCDQHQIKLLLINGRLSKKSLTSYQKLSALMAPCLNRFDMILTQSQENLTHFLQLGAHQSRCVNSGNLKFDISVNEQVINKKAELAKLLFADDSQAKRTVWLVASTHEGDEAITLTAFKELLSQYPSLLLVLVPRHPERFEQVANLCLTKQLSLAKRSENTIINNEQVWLLDSLGELMAAFALSDIVTMGGSFSEVGGHNPLEPALFNKPVIVGHNMSNFNEIMQQLRQENAIIELTNNTPTNESSAQLVNEVSALLQQPTRQKTLGENALKVVLKNQGASEKTLAQVVNLLPTRVNITSTTPLGDNS